MDKRSGGVFSDGSGRAQNASLTLRNVSRTGKLLENHEREAQETYEKGKYIRSQNPRFSAGVLMMFWENRSNRIKKLQASGKTPEGAA